jgi:hypothetical protein
MKVCAALLSLLLVGCAADVADTPTVAPRATEPDHSLSAFGGRLLGTDRGEWIGQLVFERPNGKQETLLRENVIGIIRNPSGVYVFTGLAHMGGNDGFIYRVAPSSAGHINITLLGRLPGVPSNITQDPQQVVSFLVSTGLFDSAGREVLQCLRLIGEQVEPGHACLPPRKLGSNNSSKPNLLRRSA